MSKNAAEANSNTSTVDLALDSIYLLKRPGQRMAEQLSPGYAEVRGWLEKSPGSGESWLRQAAESGDVFAMERLGERLLEGSGLPQSPDEGSLWLRKSAQLGNTFAMEKLGKHLLDGEVLRPSPGEGEAYLSKAAEEGNQGAIVSLALRLIMGEGLPRDPERGRDLLYKAANDSPLAATVLAAHLLGGRGIDRSQEEANRWLRLVGIHDSDGMVSIGMRLYLKRGGVSTAKESRLFAEAAAILFMEAISLGNTSGALTLAYLLRRGEIPEAAYPPLDELLAPHIDSGDSFAAVNQALRLAAGRQCTVDWRGADQIIEGLDATDVLLDWWIRLCRAGDAEGNLVVGWLCRHRLILDPDGFDIRDRMDIARDAGWQIPEWLEQPGLSAENPGQ